MIIKSKEETFNVDVCSSFISHLIGFMFRFPKNDGLLFIFNKEKFITLHTFFVFRKLDIIYLNKNKKIIKILKNVFPFTFYIPPVKCKYILELKDLKTLQLNDKISFK